MQSAPHMTVLILLGCVFGIFACEDRAATEPGLPNIVLVLVDDMGYGDAGAYNPSSKIPTPHIDRLAEEGIRFTDAHSPSAVCTPTRYALLTGRYAWRTSLKRGVYWGYSTHMIDTARVTIPSMLQDREYVTGGVGKWHLGLGTGDSTDYFQPFSISPNDHGFDYYYGIPASLDMQPYVYFENDRVIEEPTDYIEASAHRRQRGNGFWRGGPIAPNFSHEGVLMRTTEKAVAFLEERAGQPETPFFLYVSYSGPHTPWLPTEEYRGASEAGYYGDFMVQVDAAFGDVLQALDRFGLASNTLVIFTSDNGAHWLPTDVERFGHRANLHLRGQKADIWEGGHRVPFIARWPGEIPEGEVNNETVTHTDLFATIAGLIGYDIPSDAGEDSYNILPALLNEPIESPLRVSTIHHSLDGMFALRVGDWKWIEGRGSGGFTPPVRFEAAEGEPKGQLYHLAEDPGEQHNLYAQHPERVEQMQRMLEGYRKAGFSVERKSRE